MFCDTIRNLYFYNLGSASDLYIRKYVVQFVAQIRFFSCFNVEQIDVMSDGYGRCRWIRLSPMMSSRLRFPSTLENTLGKNKKWTAHLNWIGINKLKLDTQHNYLYACIVCIIYLLFYLYKVVLLKLQRWTESYVYFWW